MEKLDKNFNSNITVSDYITLVRGIYIKQLDNVSQFGYCVDRKEKIHKYKNIDEFKKNVVSQITEFIESGDLKKDIDIDDIINEFDKNID
jgi:hypothetical protein